MQEVAHTKPELCEALAALHAEPALDVIDESDLYTDSRDQMTYSVDKPIPLPDCAVRYDVAASALHALGLVATELPRTLSGGTSSRDVSDFVASVDVTEHEGHWGGAPDLRLVQGAHILSCSCALARLSSQQPRRYLEDGERTAHVGISQKAH